MRSIVRVGAITFALVMCCDFAQAQGAADQQDFERIARGRYLTIAADCAACHDDPITQLPFAGGRPIETPFGNVVAPNITPDRETGIGAWTDQDFDRLMRCGEMPNGKRVYPAMPFQYFAKMSARDVRAIRAYLNTVKPVHHEVRSDQLPFPFSIRAGMRVWDALYFDDSEFKPDPNRSAQWNRGAYLVEGAGHCGACHTPKTRLGGDKTDEKLKGYAIQGWFAPNITNDPERGIGKWSVADIAAYLKNGHNKIAAASGPMSEEVSHASSKMTRADLEAIAVYLKQGSEAGTEQRARPLLSNDPLMTAGAAIYGDLCSACHRADGKGVPYLIPNLAAANSVASPDPASLLRVVIEGSQSVATDAEPTGPAMPAFGWQLTDEQIAAVTTYVRNSWGHAAPTVTEADAHHARQTLLAKND